MIKVFLQKKVGYLVKKVKSFFNDLNDVMNDDFGHYSKTANPELTVYWKELYEKRYGKE